jgi:hypothetical protein
MKKLIAALVAAMFALGTGASFAADATAKPAVEKKAKKMKKAKAMKKDDAMKK